MGQARNDDERAFVERLYDEALAEGPDFINYRGKSAFLAAPTNAYTIQEPQGLGAIALRMFRQATSSASSRRTGSAGSSWAEG